MFYLEKNEIYESMQKLIYLVLITFLFSIQGFSQIGSKAHCNDLASNSSKNLDKIRAVTSSTVVSEKDQYDISIESRMVTVRGPEGVGNGWLIAPNVVVVNAHGVIRGSTFLSTDACSAEILVRPGQIEHSFRSGNVAIKSYGNKRDIVPSYHAKEGMQDNEHDYVFLVFDQPVLEYDGQENKDLCKHTQTLRSDQVLAGDPVNGSLHLKSKLMDDSIEGNDKRGVYTTENCSVDKNHNCLSDGTVKHTCTTLPGNSGSVLFDDAGRFFGFHSQRTLAIRFDHIYQSFNKLKNSGKINILPCAGFQQN